MEIKDSYIRNIIQIIDIYDGDTFTALVDVGFDTSRTVKFRFKGINTAELKGSTGLRLQLAYEAKAYVEKTLKGRKIRVHSERFEKGGYGRYLATIYYQNDKGEWINLNQELLDKGLAQHYYKGESKDFGEWHK